MQNIIKKAGVLVEAIPYIHAFRRKVFVIKYGGSILEDATVRRNILEDIVFLSYVGIRTVLVHGGGPHVSSRLRDTGVQPKFHNGIRITDKDTLNIVVEEFERLNQKLVEEIRSLKGDVTGLTGDELLLDVCKRESDVDLGFVGQVTGIHRDVIAHHLRDGYITVVSPIGYDSDGQHYNINADDVACALAGGMKAEKLVLLTDVHGVMRDRGDINSLYSTLTKSEVESLIKQKIIEGGMIPKVAACLDALDKGVHKTHIIDARTQRALLLEVFTDQGIGTQIL